MSLSSLGEYRRKRRFDETREPEPGKPLAAGDRSIFDRGVWATADDPQRQLAKGHLRFELFGDRLRGGWHLTRSASSWRARPTPCH